MGQVLINGENGVTYWYEFMISGRKQDTQCRTFETRLDLCILESFEVAVLFNPLGSHFFLLFKM
jgi:hypothetical protein